MILPGRFVVLLLHQPARIVCIPHFLLFFPTINHRSQRQRHFFAFYPSLPLFSPTIKQHFLQLRQIPARRRHREQLPQSRLIKRLVLPPIQRPDMHRRRQARQQRSFVVRRRASSHRTASLHLGRREFRRFARLALSGLHRLVQTRRVAVAPTHRPRPIPRFPVALPPPRHEGRRAAERAAATEELLRLGDHAAARNQVVRAADAVERVEGEVGSGEIGSQRLAFGGNVAVGEEARDYARCALVVDRLAGCWEKGRKREVRSRRKYQSS